MEQILETFEILSLGCPVKAPDNIKDLVNLSWLYVSAFTALKVLVRRFSRETTDQYIASMHI
jgi:hypothetical protein